MVKHLILVGHGSFCDGLKESLEMIMEPQDNVHTVCLYPEEGAQDFENKFRATWEKYDDVLVFADLLGGTPCNVVSRLIMSGEAIDLYAGVNLPMIIRFVNNQLIGEESPYDDKASEMITHVNRLLADMAADEDE